MDGTPLPSTIEEVESLVLALYNPASSSTVSQTQTTLQQLQKSPQGWELARHLLSRPDPNVKFFGALTIIIKLRTSSSSLSTNDALELLEFLIGCLMRILDEGGAVIVLRKLVTALSSLFLHFPRLWPRCVFHLVYCLGSGTICRSDAVDASTEFQIYLGTLGLPALQAVTWFSTVVAEDATKTDLNSPMHSGLYESIMTSLGDITALILRAISSRALQSGHMASTVGNDGIKCFQAWVWFAQRVSARDGGLTAPLRPLTRPVIESMLVEDLSETSVEAVSEILSNYSGFLTADFYEMMYAVFETEWYRAHYRQLVEGGDFDSELVQFGQLLLAFGDVQVQDLIEDTASRGRSGRILSDLCGLLGAPGVPVVEDRIFVPALEFWSTYVETVTDSLYSGGGFGTQQWAPLAVEQVRRVISLVWQKIAFPVPEVVASWDSAERAGFVDARKDVADLLQSAFTILGHELVSTFAEATREALRNGTWFQLEAVAFCLGALADCANGDGKHDDILEPTFGPSFFDTLDPSRREMPAQTRRTCALLIDKYAEYFERHPEILPRALRSLFGILADPQMAGSASRIIHRLSSSCRRHLGPEANAFMDQYEALASTPVLDCLISERLLGAVAAAIQTLEGEAEMTLALARLLQFIRSDLDRSLETRSHSGAVGLDLPCRRADRCSQALSTPDIATHLAIRALRCLLGVARGLQAPAEGPIDIDSGDKFAMAAQLGPAMQQLQAGVVSMMVQARAAFPANGEVVEIICGILRTGFSETRPGLFVLPPNQVCEYFASHGLGVPRIGLIVSTACSFMNSPGTVAAHEFGAIKGRMLEWVISLLKEMPQHDSDTELSQNGIELVTRLIVKNPGVLFQSMSPSSVEYFFFFTLRVLEGNEPLPKTTSADFWAKFILLKSNDPYVESCLRNAVTAVGPMLAHALVRNIGGKASRSDLDKICEPLKRLLCSSPKARGWIEAALLDPSFPSQNVSDTDKSVFLKQIISLRGGQQTNLIVRDFWLASRGLSFAYAS